jgi:hypothetical protein
MAASAGRGAHRGRLDPGLGLAGIARGSGTYSSLLVKPLDAAVRIGFERTLEQDPALGLRQLVDVACKALSPAVNDPYTAVQAIEHLTVLFAEFAARPSGPRSGGQTLSWWRFLPGLYPKSSPVSLASSVDPGPKNRRSSRR